MPSARIRKVVANLALVMASLIVALLLGELMVRRLVPQARPLSVALRHLYDLDEQLGYVMTPGFERRIRTSNFTADVRTNELGLRDHAIGARQDHTLRVLCIGDSFTFGVHAGALENCYVKRLERKVAQQLATASNNVPMSRSARWQNAEFINAGVDGYGTVQEVGLLERLGPTLEPNAVLVAFFMGNDFTDNSGHTRMTVLDGFLALQGSLDPRQTPERPWHQHVRLYLHAKSELYLLLKRRLLHPVRGRLFGAGSSTARASGRQFDYYVFDSGFADCMRPESTAIWEEGRQATREAFQRLRLWCDANNSQVLVFGIPTPMQIDPRRRERWLRRFDLDAEEFDFNLPNRRLATLAKEAGLPFFDLTPDLTAAAARGVEISFIDDEHWTARGHQVAAGLLTDPVLKDLVGASPADVHVSRDHKDAG